MVSEEFRQLGAAISDKLNFGNAGFSGAFKGAMTTPPPPRKRGPSLPGFRTPGDSRTLWFSRTGCVVWHANGRRDVLMGGAFLGSYEKGDTAARNVLLVMLTKQEVVLEDVAHAFGMTSEALRLIRRAYEEGGYAAVVKRKRGGQGPWKVTAKVKQAVEACFAEGLDVPGMRRKLKGLLSVGTLRKLHKEWTATRAAEEARGSESPAQQGLPLEVESLPPAATTPPVAPIAEEMLANAGALTTKKPQSSYVVNAPTPGEDENVVDGRTLAVVGPRSEKRVQFLGAWLLVAMTARLGLHAAITSESATKGAGPALRLAVDAVTVALGIGQGCVEGVRRLAHQAAAALLLSLRAPSPTWVRETLGRAAAEGRGFFIRARVSGDLMRAAAGRAGELAVFYIDSHMRLYAGQQRLLRGWRMQDKRARPGTSDLHVHDADGRPLYRVATLMHDSLGKLLLPIAVDAHAR